MILIHIKIIFYDLWLWDSVNGGDPHPINFIKLVKYWYIYHEQFISLI